MRVILAAAGVQFAWAGGLSAPVQALQAQMAAVEATVKATGRVTPQVKATVNKMKDMITNHIETAIRQAHLMDQGEINRLHARIDTCDKNLLTWSVGPGGSLDQDMYAREASWRAGRHDLLQCEAAAEQTRISRRSLARQAGDRECVLKQQQVDRVKLTRAFATCDYTTQEPEDCYAATLDLVSYLKGHFHEQDSRYHDSKEQLRQIEHQRKLKDIAVQGEVEECCQLAGSLNEMADRHNGMIAAFNESSQHACADYDSCRLRTEQAFLKFTGLDGHCDLNADPYASPTECAMSRARDRELEWTSTQTIKCMLQHYCDGGKFEEVLLDQCKRHIESSHLKLKYPEVSPRKKCPEKEIDIDPLPRVNCTQDQPDPVRECSVARDPVCEVVTVGVQEPSWCHGY